MANASESADIVILVDDLYRIVDAVTGILPAIVGAGLQEIVDVVAILNALRALWLAR